MIENIIPFFEKIPFKTIHTEEKMNASKWLQMQALVDITEMRALLEGLGDFFIARTGVLGTGDQLIITKEMFLSNFMRYIEMLKARDLSQESLISSLFSTAWTRTPETLYRIQVADGRSFIRASRPVIQLQPHRLDYSPADEKFRPMILGDHSVSWGIQFSYPQLYQRGNSPEIQKVEASPLFPNTTFFKELQKMLKKMTLPTPFIVGENHKTVPMRIGKECLSWINEHPQLKKKGILVCTSKS